MNSAEKQAVLHCLKSMIDEEVCEECPLYGTTGTDHCEKDCVRLAINALEKEPCRDCISRKAVLEAIEDDNRNGHYSCFATNNDAECFKQIIRELPSVTPQQKMGYWFIDERPESDREVVCSNCEKPIFKYHKLDFDYRPKYCPHCGCAMQGA